MLIHEQVQLPDGLEVDAGIAQLLQALWGLGLRTAYSCQGTASEARGGEGVDSPAYIPFPEAAHALDFFSRALEATAVPGSPTKILVAVRVMTRAGAKDWRRRKRGPAVTLELDVHPASDEPRLRGCVRFDPELMPQIEAALAGETEKTFDRRPSYSPTAALRKESQACARNDLLW